MSAKTRAATAAKILKRNKYDLGRSFDDCFEAGDGDDVYRHLVAMSDRDPELREAIHRHGYDRWLEEEYRAEHGAVFQLGNDEPESKPLPLFDSRPKAKQLPLLRGLDDEPGQLDLFDGAHVS